MTKAALILPVFAFVFILSATETPGAFAANDPLEAGLTQPDIAQPDITQKEEASSRWQPETKSVSDTLEELYESYESIDSRLESLEREIGDLQSSAIVTPFTVTVKKERGFRLISMEVKDNGNPIWNHIYSPHENSALSHGGRQLFYKGTITMGEHTILISYSYRLPGENTHRRKSSKWTLSADEEPLILQVFFKAEGEEVLPETKKLYIFDESYLTDTDADTDTDDKDNEGS